jgi:hypothetical protein
MEKDEPFFHPRKGLQREPGGATRQIKGKGLQKTLLSKPYRSYQGIPNVYAYIFMLPIEKIDFLPCLKI